MLHIFAPATPLIDLERVDFITASATVLGRDHIPVPTGLLSLKPANKRHATFPFSVDALRSDLLRTKYGALE